MYTTDPFFKRRNNFVTCTCASCCNFVNDSFISRSQAPQMSARLSQAPPGEFPDGLKDSYRSQDWHHCQIHAHLQGTQTGDLAYFSLPGQKHNFWRSCEGCGTSCTFVQHWHHGFFHWLLRNAWLSLWIRNSFWRDYELWQQQCNKLIVQNH